MIVRRIAFFLLVTVLSGCALTRHSQQFINKPCHALRFVTYNVYWQNNSKNKANPDSIAHIIDRLNPDIIALQETYCFSADNLEKTFKKSHPYRLFRNCNQSGNEDGLGILSKYPIVYDRYFPPVYGWFPGWLFVVKTPTGHVQVLNVHLNPKLVCSDNIGIFLEGLWATPKFRLWEIAYYHRYLNPNLPTIIAGDFNENDSGSASQFLRQHCFSDTLLTLVPHCIKTWHYKLGFVTFTGRYDRIYTKKICPIHSYVCQRGYSDHYPVVLDFTLMERYHHHNFKKNYRCSK